MTMMEKMVETRSWKEARGLIEDGNCRICRNFSEIVKHLVAGCTKLANSEYLNRHNQALMVLAVTWQNSRNCLAKMQSGISNDGTEEQYSKITKLSWYGISSFTCGKQQLSEDQT